LKNPDFVAYPNNIHVCGRSLIKYSACPFDDCLSVSLSSSSLQRKGSFFEPLLLRGMGCFPFVGCFVNLAACKREKRCFISKGKKQIKIIHAQKH
jgi:hypothetical protein